MNKTEKIICIILGAVLAWYLFSENSKAKERAKVAAEQAAIAATNETAVAATTQATSVEAAKPSETIDATVAKPIMPSDPERIVSLESDEVKFELTTWGAAVKTATLKKYAKDRGAVSESNPAVSLDFSENPLGASYRAGAVVPAFSVAEVSSNSATFVCGERKRTIRLENGYRIVLEDEGFSGGDFSIGVMRMGDSKNDLLSVDSWDLGLAKPGVVHHCEGDSPLKPYLVGGLSGGCSGCSGTQNAAGMAESASVEYPREQNWVALKNRFFVSAFVSSTARNGGFLATVRRDTKTTSYRPESVSASVVLLPGEGGKRTTTFYVGPKKQSLLWDLGMRDVMEFGMWRWVCYPLVWVLNLFNSWIPSFGIGIILLTILVRLIFWPLTHKSTISMRRMSELQPKMKEIREKFKDNPQRMQQETWALYKDNKVNPMASCLPMLVQIPVFIALFTVLRSAVELRYAPFLWISDLSEPENLFPSVFPFGGLNILPILMAVTMALQSALTPSTGDKQQQRMMMIMMPVMMLVMFYSFPSALSLYWTLSQVLSIVQMWYIRKKYTPAPVAAANDTVEAQVVTRQMRRHGC